MILQTRVYGFDLVDVFFLPTANFYSLISQNSETIYV